MFFVIVYAFLAHGHGRVHDTRARQVRVLDRCANHDKRLQIRRAHVVRDATLGAPTALMLIGFRCVCAITAQMPQKPRKRRS